MMDFPSGVTGVPAAWHAAVDYKQEPDYATTLLLLLLLEVAEIVLVY